MALQITAPDLSIYKNINGFNDYNAAAQKQGLAQALQAAQIGALQQKAQYLDVTKLGNESLVKATMGLPLSPQEEAAAKVVSAKTGGLQFDPVTGNAIQKPNLASQLGLNFGGGQQATMQQPLERPSMQPAEESVVINPEPTNQFDAMFQTELDAAAGNPKLQQQLKADYSKSKYQMNESQSKAAGFADRIVSNEPILGKPEIVDALSSNWQKGLDALPGGNYLTSDEFQSGAQAQRDFINAVLRRESGAVISPEEFKNAKLQYLPQPGDSKTVIAQKARNRETALGGIERAAGSAYQRIPQISAAEEMEMPPEIQGVGAPSFQAPKVGTKKGGYVFEGGNPADPKSWKK